MLQPVRGTHDIYGENFNRYRKVIETFNRIVSLYGYKEIITPIFEYTSVFEKNLGDTSDVVSKEMYQFLDRGGESLTLRPEHTAGVMRAIISESLHQNLPLKLMSSGPVFRYDRPQKGRYRQFNQIDVDLFGVNHPFSDSEIISIAYTLLKELGLKDKITLEINTIGDMESRLKYRDMLVHYFEPYKNDLSEESQKRLTRNPLRILDSKSPQDQKISENVPLFGQALTDSAKAYFEGVLNGLALLNIPYQHNQKLVRGLDYYCHTAFEFTTQELGAQGTVLAGGRYDGLCKQMGGPDLPAIGWAAGVERLALLLNEGEAESPSIMLIAIRQNELETVFKLASSLRGDGHKVEFFYQGNMQKQLKKANKSNTKIAILLGEEEVKSQEALVRHFESGEQTKVPFEQLSAFLGAL
jgi:histidyl-tRNA synthetase